MPKQILVLQLRPENDASDEEFEAIVKFSKKPLDLFQRIRMERNELTSELNLRDYCAVIVGGGPSNVSADDSNKYPEQKIFEPKLRKLIDEIIDKDFPYLGACYGLGILAQQLGGVVDNTYSEEVGAVEIQLTNSVLNDVVFKYIDLNFYAYVGHKEAVEELPNNVSVIGTSTTCPVQAIKYKANIYATQFHPELDHPTLASRIDIYKNHGYFKPDDSEQLKQEAGKYPVTEPMKILKNFVDHYSN